MQEILITESRLARLFQFSERKARDYFKSARVAPGKYDLLQAIEIYVENASGTDEANALKKAEKELKEYKLKILKKEYHHESDVTRIVSNMNYNFKSKLLSLPSKLSAQLVNKNNQLEIKDILKKAIIDVLEELIEYKFDKNQEELEDDIRNTYTETD